MRTKSDIKKHLKNNKKVCTPQNRQSNTTSETPGKIKEENEKIVSPILNFHIHISPMCGNILMPEVPSIQPAIHLHFDDIMKKNNLEETSAFKNVMKDSVNLLNMLAMASNKHVNETVSHDGDSSSFHTPKTNFENLNLGQSSSGHKNESLESDQDGTDSESNCILNKETTEKKSKSNRTHKLKGSIKKKKDKDIKPIMPSLEKRINSLRKYHQQQSTPSCHEADKKLDSVRNSVNENDNLVFRDIENTFKFKRAIVVLEDISREISHLLPAADVSENAKIKKSPCSASKSNREIASCSNGDSTSKQGGYFLRIRDTSMKKSVSYNLGSPKKNNDLYEIKETPKRNNTKTTSMATQKNSFRGNMNGSPRKIIITEKPIKTPKKNILTEEASRKLEKCIDTEDPNRTPLNNSGTDSMSGQNNDTENTNKTPKKWNDIEDTKSYTNTTPDDANSAPEKNGVIKRKGETLEKSYDTEDIKRTPEKNSDTEGTKRTPKKNSDTEDKKRNSEKNGDMNEMLSELTKRQRGVYSDSDNSEGDSKEESDTEVDEENVKNDENQLRLGKSAENSYRDSISSSDNLDSDWKESAEKETANSPRKFNSPEETPKSSLTSTRIFGNYKLDQTPVKCSNGSASEKSSESEDSDANEESEYPKNREPATPRKRKNEAYNSVYGSNEEVTSESNLSSVMEGCNFSEILLKIQNKSLRDKIMDVAERRRTTSECVQYKGQREKVQEEEERGTGETIDSGRERGATEENEKIEDMNFDNNDDTLTPRSTNEDDKSTVEFKGIVSPGRESIIDYDDELVEPNLEENFRKALFTNPKSPLTHYESDKSNSNLEGCLSSEETEVLDEISKKLRSFHEVSQQSPKSKKTESLDVNNTQVDGSEKEMRKRGQDKKSGEKRKRKPKRSPMKMGGEKKNVPSSKTSPPEETKRRKSSKTKPGAGGKKPRMSISLEGSYIPLQSSGSTRFAVAPLDEVKPYEKHEAFNFKHQMLFGDRVERFSSSKELEMYKLKQKTRDGLF